MKFVVFVLLLIPFVLSAPSGIQTQSENLDALALEPYRGQAVDPRAARFDRITVSDGLPENTVMAFLQDKLGFIWLGTQRGLVRFDGQTMETVEKDPDDANSFGGRASVKHILEAKNGDLWIGTHNSGLVKRSRSDGKFEIIANPQVDIESVSPDGNGIEYVWEDSDGYIWMLTSDEHVDRYNPATGTTICSATILQTRQQFPAISLVRRYPIE